MRIDLSMGEFSLAATTAAGATAARGGTTLFTGLSGIDLAVGELGLLSALVWLTVFAETVVLCNIYLASANKIAKKEKEAIAIL